MKILTVIGARPQFIKASVVSHEILKHPELEEVIVHTGQHFDKNMSQIFFEEMGLPKPKYYLDIHSIPHGAMTGRMLEAIEKIIFEEKPDLVMVYGDTNSTLAGALAAKKQKIKLAHVEAGLRSNNMKMPEEINRILTDRISDFLFCPTEHAVRNLEKEGFKNFPCEIILTGDVMYDASRFFSKYAKIPQFKVPEKFILVTIHREENTDNLSRLISIIEALNYISSNIPIIFPIHPRTKKIIEKNNIKLNFEPVEPVSYLEMLFLLKKCMIVMTDSGGLQKEAFFFRKPCITFREETEWEELVESGCNILAGTNKDKILESLSMIKKKMDFDCLFYGTGNARKKIVDKLLEISRH